MESHRASKIALAIQWVDILPLPRLEPRTSTRRVGEAPASPNVKLKRGSTIATEIRPGLRGKLGNFARNAPILYSALIGPMGVERPPMANWAPRVKILTIRKTFPTPPVLRVVFRVRLSRPIQPPYNYAVFRAAAFSKITRFSPRKGEFGGPPSQCKSMA